MKVLLFNGSSHPDGTTNHALEVIAQTLNEHQIATEILQIGGQAIADCLACGQCQTSHQCVINNDVVNTWIAKAATADAFIFGSPVYYAHPTGRLLAAMDRMFYAGAANFRHKPAAAITTARRAGTTASMDVINKYFAFNQMPIVTSTYWNHVFRDHHGTNADAEGLQTMRNLAHNLAWLLQCLDAGKKAGLTPPNNTTPRTNFLS